MNLSPLLLVPDKKVHIHEDLESDSEKATYLDIVTGKGFDPAEVTDQNFRQQDISFELYLNIKRVTAFFRQMGNGGLSFEEFKFAFLTKELSLIRYGATEYLHLIPVGMPYAGNQVWGYIFDLMELRRCRYRLSCDLPAFSRYIVIYSACVRKNISMEMVRQDMERFQHVLPEFKRISAMLEELYNLVIFHRTPDDSPLVEYALPHVLMAERGDVHTSARAAKAVYNYILLPNELHKLFRFRFTDIPMEMEEAFEELPQEERPQIREDEATGFYRDVLMRRMDEITRIRNVFRRVFTLTRQVEVFEGDIDLRKQQQLYIDSITGEEGRTYLQRRFRNTTMDVVVLRDISFSTDLFRVEYAEAVITLMAALEGIAAVQTAQIDFSDVPKLNKSFEQPITQSSIAPYAFGATRLGEALDMMEGFNFRASKRLAVVITDGEIEDQEQCRATMERLSREKGIFFFMIHIVPEECDGIAETGEEEAVCCMAKLDKVLFEVLMREVV